MRLILYLFLIIPISYYSQNNNTGKISFESECMGAELDGSQTIKAWGTGRNYSDACEQAKKNAVHGIIFRGFGSKDRVEGKPALTNNPNLEMEKQEFFDDFFMDGGKYMKFVNVTGDGSVAAEDRLKVGKEYKIGVVVSINVTLLRKDLETAGIIKGFAAGF